MSSPNTARAVGDCRPSTSTFEKRNLEKELLQVGEVAKLTGLSVSYFEKGRIYGYGPNFIRLPSAGKTGKILYRRSAVEAWLTENECKPGGFRNA